MTSTYFLPPCRRRGWWFLEFGAALVIVTALLGARIASDLGHAVTHTQQRRRRLAYFLLRGMAAEIETSLYPPDPFEGPLCELEGLRREIPRLKLTLVSRGDLQRLRVEIARAPDGWFVEIRGPGTRERRSLRGQW